MTVENQRFVEVLIYCVSTISVYCMIDIRDVVRTSFWPTESLNSSDGPD